MAHWRRNVVLGAGAAALLAVGGAAISQLTSDLSAVAAVHSAQRAEVDSFEGTLTFEEPDGSTLTWAIRGSHDDYEVDITAVDADGRVERGLVTMVGDRTYISTDDRGDIVSPRSPGDGLDPPIADLAEAVTGALERSDSTTTGTEVVAGSVTTRHEVELTDRSIAAFSEPVRIVSPDVTRLTVWTAGQYPRQIEMATASGYRETLTFRVIGGRVTIAAPAGDYSFDPEPDLDPALRFPVDAD
jgi:hypothetical protein